MRTYITLIALLAFASCNKNCEKTGKHKSVTYANNSDRNIEYIVVNNYPDTRWPESFKTAPQPNTLAPRSSYEVQSPKGKCIESSFSDGKTYWVYFVNTDSLNKHGRYSHDAYTYEKVLLERRAVNLLYLEENNFVISYDE